MTDLTTAELLHQLAGQLTARQLHRLLRDGIFTIDTPGAGSGNGGHRFAPAEAAAIADYLTMRDRIRSGAYYHERLAHHLQPASTAEEIAQKIYDDHYPDAIAGRGRGEQALRFALQELIALLGAAGALSPTA